MASTDHDPLEPEAQPPAILHRDEEQAALHTAITSPGSQHLYVYGPRGVGKTLLVRDILASATTATTYYVPCIHYNTQYKVLKRLCERASDESINPGYHTAQLQQHFANHVGNTPMIIVLDDLAFLLANDGNDLLYFLSRLDRHAALSIVGIAAQPSLLPNLDERTYSSLRPQHLAIPPYTEADIAHILTNRVETALSPEAGTAAAFEYLAATTSNLTLGLHWLTCAADHAAEITANVLQTVQDDAVHRYRDALLTAFSWHHTVLLNVIDEATTERATVTTGTVYDHYREHCQTAGKDPLTARRISDYLTHLELLNLINVTHYHGGERGKTREIRPTPLEEL